MLMRRRQDTWDRLQAEMSSKRVKVADAMSGARKKKGSAPNEIIVQRLASEPDSKQTYRTHWFHPITLNLMEQQRGL